MARHATRSLALLALLAAAGTHAQTLISLYSVRSPNSQNNGYFGSHLDSVADVTGDGVADLVVGAPDEASGQGRVYLYNGATGALVRTIASPAPQAGTAFGADVAGIGDVNGDGTPDLLASGYFPVGGVANAGRVSLFSGATGAVLRSFESPDAQAGGYFGFNVDSPGDLTGDGVPDVVVGAGDEDVLVGGTRVTDHGAVYAFNGATGALLWTSTPQTQDANSYYGRVRAVGGDVTGDGVPDVIAGAAQAHNASGASTGAAYLVSGSDGRIVYTLQSGTPQAGGNFGFALAGLPDVTGDGVRDVAVGAPYEDVQGTGDDGTVSFFNGATGARIATYVEEDRQTSRLFGWHIEAIGDLDGDGTGDVAVTSRQQYNGPGARPAPYSAPFSGAVVVASGATIGQQTDEEFITLYPGLPSTLSNFNYRFGEDVAALGDVDGDGRPDMAVGAPTQGANIGFVAVFPGDRLLSISPASITAQAEQSVAASGTFDFGATGVDLVLTGVATLDGDAPAGIVAAPVVVRVERHSATPTDVSGIAQANVANYRWIVTKEGALSFGATSAVRLRVSEIPNAGITRPETVVVYYRAAIGDAFAALPTTYDASTGEIVATGFGTGEITFASTDNVLPAETDAASDGLRLAASPNPARDAATLTLTLGTPQTATVAVFDVLGREVARVHAGPLAAGVHTLRLDTAAWPAGVYVVRVTGATATRAQRLTVVR